jgi:hypothetical protein
MKVSQMADIYKVPKLLRENEVLFCYRYNEENIDLHRSINMPISFQSPDLRSEDDFMKLWIDFSLFPFNSSSTESNIRPWKGHCEQFARVMLQFMRMCNKRLTWDGRDVPNLHSIMPAREVISGSFWHPARNSEHDWYRAWYSLIGHPDYLRVDARGSFEAFEYQKKKFLLAAVIYDLSDFLKSEQLLNQNIGLDIKEEKKRVKRKNNK